MAIKCKICSHIYYEVGECPVCNKTGKQSKKSGHSKYHNKRVEKEGEVFQSQFECDYYFNTLLPLKRTGRIKEMWRQVSFPIGAGIRYVADFLILWGTYERLEIIDTKGYSTREFKNKMKMWNAKYNVPITIVRK